MAAVERRLRAALLATLGFGVALGVAFLAVSTIVPVTGADASTWLTVAMVVGAVAGFLSVLLRLPASGRAVAIVVLPAIGAAAAFLLVGGVLYGLGGGDPLRGPTFALAQFASAGLYLTIALALVASALFLMGTSPHRTGPSRRVG